MELVGLYDEAGRPTGRTADRARVRAENLRHAATAVVVRNGLGEVDYADARTRYAFCFACTWDGPVTWQPEEVAWGDWVSPARLLELLEEQPFVPDTPS